MTIEVRVRRRGHVGPLAEGIGHEVDLPQVVSCIEPELGQLAKIFSQDTFNLPKVQLGLKAQEQQEVIFASYNESKLRHFHELLKRWLELD